MKDKLNTFPASKLLYVPTNELNAEFNERSTLYPVTPTLSVEASHAPAALFDVTDVNLLFAGTEGAVPSAVFVVATPELADPLPAAS